MKLSDWARKEKIHYNTAYAWFHSGRIPNAYQMDTGTIIVPEIEITTRKENICVYARVSLNKQKQDMERQIERITQFVNVQGISIDKIYKEVASGMNDKRKQLCAMLDKKPTKIFVEHKDRLTRFGFNYLEILLNQMGCEVIVMNKDRECENDLMKDLVSIITSFCCRLYGLRKGQNKARSLKEKLQEEKQN